MAFHLRKYRNWTYFSFLSFHHDVIVISSFLNGLNRNDDVWVKQFLREAKCLDPNNFTAIEKEAPKQDCSHYAKELQTFWEGVIEECGDTFANAFEVDIEKNNSICKLKDIIKKKNTQTLT
ncbi:22760_t:CDS:2, partial [Rhizophagus irregularis]